MNHVHVWHVDTVGVGYCDCDPLTLRQFRDWRAPYELTDRHSWNSAVYGGTRLQLPKLEDESYA
jgi:hypothetical protein